MLKTATKAYNSKEKALLLHRFINLKQKNDEETDIDNRDAGFRNDSRYGPEAGRD